MEVSNQLPATYASCTLYTLLIDGMNWLKNALEILPPCNDRQIKVDDAEEVLGLSQVFFNCFFFFLDYLSQSGTGVFLRDFGLFKSVHALHTLLCSLYFRTIVQ